MGHFGPMARPDLVAAAMLEAFSSPPSPQLSGGVLG
jgi:hypothetical protein